jgi:pimeloyl-ACP methyl ester carboxylesterase
VKKLVAAAATTGLVTGLGLLGATNASAAADVSDAFHPASLTWQACPPDIVAGAKAYDRLGPVQVSKIIQCAELQVPLDYAHPEGQKITLQLTRTPHTGTGEAKGDIVVNPGGPGGGGALFGPRVFAQNSAPMQAAYNVIGFDPRGVGFSTPSLSCDVNYNNAPRPAYGTGGKQDEATWLKISKDYADACAKKFGAGSKVNLLDHIKTIDSVRDINTIRAALGRQKLDYYGASYGTYLGQVYATLFPKRVGRMVLDGNVTPKNVWYEGQLAQDIAFDKNIEYYFGWIAKYDSTYHLGDTQAKVRKFYYDLQAKLTKQPVTFKDPQTGATVAVGPDELVDNMLTAGYRRSQGVWNAYASGLSAYKSGDIETFAGTFGGPTTGGSDDNGFAVYLAVQCTDTQWPMSWPKWHNDAVRVNKMAPFETWGNVWFNAPCLYWGAKAGTPVKVGQTKDLPKNILMFQSTEDGATPYAGALELHKILKGSHLVVQDGDRTHCIVHRGDLRPGGVDSYFDAYFLNGTLPDKDTVHVSQLGDPAPPSASASTLQSTQSSTQQFNDVIK